MIWLNDGDGLVGYAPDPKLVLRVITLARSVRLKPSTSASNWHATGNVEDAADASPEREECGSRSRVARVNSPFTIGRPAVPWTVVTPDVMLKGGAQVDLQHAADLEPVRQVFPCAIGGRRRGVQ